MPAVEGGSLAAGENRKIARPLAHNQPLVLAKPVPPGWKHRLYGRQDARRYGGSDRKMRPAARAVEKAAADVSLSKMSAPQDV